MIAFHCDRDGCDTWQRNPSETFLTVSGRGEISHLCSFDCLTHWAATFGPKETFELP